MFKSGDQVRSETRRPQMDAGRHNRAKLGFILMSTDLAAEADFALMAPQGVGVHITRLKTDDYTTNETLSRHIDHMAEAAARIQPDTRPDVVSYSCTSGSIVIGEDRVMAEIAKGAPWAKPMCLVTGVMDALRELGAQKIVVGTPYLDEVNTAEAEFLLEKGIDVLDIQGLNLALDSEMVRVTPSFLADMAVGMDRPDADAIFISCGALRSIDIIQEVEARTGKPCITSNQALAWDALRLAGIDDRIDGFGRLLQQH